MTKLLILGLIAGLSSSLFADISARQALQDLGERLTPNLVSIHYLGVDSDGEVCEIVVDKSELLFLATKHGEIVVDDAYNAYFGNKTESMQSRAHVLENSVHRRNGIEITQVEVSSDADHSYAYFLLVKSAEGRFAAGEFHLVRPKLYDNTCVFHAEIPNYSKPGETLLNSTIGKPN